MLDKKFSKFSSKNLLNKLMKGGVKSEIEAIAIAKIIEKRFPTPANVANGSSVAA